MKMQWLPLDVKNLVALICVIVCAGAHAEICNNLEDCKQVDLEVQKKINELLPSPRLKPEYRYPNLYIKEVTYNEAEEYCAEMGSRLPTIKEMALALNREGVSQTRKEYFEVRTYLFGKRKFDFYYTPYSYRPQNLRHDENYVYWTSSESEENTKYTFGVDSGFLRDRHPLAKAAVRCLEN